jgi:hypothetical protein
MKVAKVLKRHEKAVEDIDADLVNFHPDLYYRIDI